MNSTDLQQAHHSRAAEVEDMAHTGVGNLWTGEGSVMGISDARKKDRRGDIVITDFSAVIPTAYPGQSTGYSTGGVYEKTARDMDISGLSTYPRC